MKTVLFSATLATVLLIGIGAGCAGSRPPANQPQPAARVSTEGRRESSLRVIKPADDLRAASNPDVASSAEPVFSAIGRRPSFYLVLDDEGGLRVQAETLRDPLVLGHVIRRVDATSSATLLHGDVQGHLVQVELQQQPCNDTTTGELFPYTVFLRVDTQLLKGCGSGQP